MKPKLESGSHKEVRGVMQVVGPLMVVVGGLFALIGLGSFFSSFGSFEPPRFFWCAFIGLPMVGIGLSICKVAYLGSIQRYVASETAPVARDTFNYMVDGTQDSVKTLSRSVAEGLRDGMGAKEDDTVACSQCGDLNASDANFCNGCGSPLTHTQTCGRCNEENDAAAKFCDRCGNAL